MLRICSVVEDAFLYSHLEHHRINSGDQISDKIKRSTSAKQNTQNLPESFLRNHAISENDNDIVNLPADFPYLDILKGIRNENTAKGYLESSSEKMLYAAKNGDYEQVKKILEEGLVTPDVTDKTGFSSLMAAAVSFVGIYAVLSKLIRTTTNSLWFCLMELAIFTFKINQSI